LPIAGQKFPRYFKGSLEFFAVYKKFYVFISLFFTVSLSMFRGAVLGKSWPLPCSEGKVVRGGDMGGYERREETYWFCAWRYNCFLLTYLLTPWSRVPLEKLTSKLCS